MPGCPGFYKLCVDFTTDFWDMLHCYSHLTNEETQGQSFTSLFFSNDPQFPTCLLLAIVLHTSRLNVGVTQPRASSVLPSSGAGTDNTSTQAEFTWSSCSQAGTQDCQRAYYVFLQGSLCTEGSICLSWYLFISHTSLPTLLLPWWPPRTSFRSRMSSRRETYLFPCT